MEKKTFEANFDSHMTQSSSDFKLPGQISLLVGISEKSFSIQNKPLDISFQET
jgi:hypothetical protein